jgi:hypothetical protein
MTCICPCLLTIPSNNSQLQDQQQRQYREQDLALQPIHSHPVLIPNLTIDNGADDLRSSLLVSTRPLKETIEYEDLTCDTLIMKNDHGSSDLLSDENDVTIDVTSSIADQLSNISAHTTLPIQAHPHLNRSRSKSDGQTGFNQLTNSLADNKSLR